MKPPRILEWPAAELQRVAKTVTVYGKPMTHLCEQMVEAMTRAGGIGLAAPQLGINKRVIIVREMEKDGHPILCLVNPEILEADGSFSVQEGCLSVPGHYVTVARPANIRVRWRTVDGQPMVRWFHSIRYPDLITAQIIGHECDHLLGRTILHHEGGSVW
jgi:peptide deformylase